MKHLERIWCYVALSVFYDSRQWRTETRVKRSDGVNAGAAAGLHLTSRCAICVQSFEWVSCHKGMRLVLRADTGFERLPLLVFIMSWERTKAPSKVLLYKSSLCLIPGGGAELKPELRKESQDFICILGISLLWYRVGKKGIWNFNALWLTSRWICCLAVYLIWVSHDSIIGFAH